MKISIIKLHICIAVLSILIGCKKDNVSKEDNRDIQITKVEFIESNELSKGVYNYKYDSTGQLNDIILEALGYSSNPIEIIKSENQIQLVYLEGVADFGWMDTKILISQNKVEKINVLTKLLTMLSIEGELEINRKDNKFERIMFSDYVSNSVTTYFPIESKVLKYNQYDLPESTVMDSKFIRNDKYSKYMAYFNFEYVEALSIPKKLKRLINEELLFLNRYGVTNADFDFFLNNNTSVLYGNNNGNQYGEGNWLISFGLPQYYILEEKSNYMVSKRTTDIYQIDEAGEEKYLKTKVEDFPYKHDVEAKILEIAGLKIWYEFVE
ncbi:MAG: hypothetical protein M9958_05795 [Chitinophagales bacterium]|nr:hypothetical protein [Chitinophagales bacterium]